MKNLFIMGLITSASLGFGKNYNSHIGNKMFSLKNVVAYTSVAESLNNIDQESIDDTFGYAVVDCSKNPVTFSQVDTSYCYVEAKKSYGWYADPVLVLTVSGYIKKDKQEEANLVDEDFIIIDVVVSTPLPTGLE